MKFIAACFIAVMSTFSAHAQFDQFLLIGTYTNNGSEGIYVYKFNTATGEMAYVSKARAENPSYLDITPNGKFVYAVGENGGDRPGDVNAFEFDSKTGQLRFLNREGSGGDHPCYVSVAMQNSGGYYVTAANYTGGSFSVRKTTPEGILATGVQVVQHYGSSVHPGRQTKPHVHSTIFSPGEKYLLVSDLGMDEVRIYPFSKKSEMPIDTTKVIVVKTSPAAGPRHLAFHKTLPVFYVVEEISGTVTAWELHKKDAEKLQTIASDTITQTDDKGSADIHLSPDGRFLYTTNRGKANNIAIYAVDAKTGLLSIKGYSSVLGEKPRNFMIDPTGNFLLVANQNSNNIVVFKRDSYTGLLTPTGKQLTEIKSPVCLKMTPVK